MASTRTPIFRAFPRVGIPPTYKNWADYERRIEFMITAGVMEDYTYLWHDVRPHPRFGTVEVRVMDSQTHIEHSLGLAALVQALVRELAQHFEAGRRLSRYPFEMLDENKWLAARHGLEGELVDLPSADRVSTRALARRLIDRMRDHCVDLGSVSELEAVEDLLTRGNGAARQVVVYEANHDLREVMAEIVAATLDN
jgi:glutamate---cysteine ligase / carboxylate-amine ligase